MCPTIVCVALYSRLLSVSVSICQLSSWLMVFCSVQVTKREIGFEQWLVLVILSSDAHVSLNGQE